MLDLALLSSQDALAVREFLARLLEAFYISENASRVVILTSAGVEASSVLLLKDTTTKDALMELVQQIVVNESRSGNVSAAFDMLMSVIFIEDNGDRPGGCL